MALAERRLATARPNQDTLQVIDRFVREFRLGDEVELGLRLIPPDKVRHLIGSPELRRRVRDAADRPDAILVELGRLDAEVEGIARVLMAGRAKKRRRSDKEKEKEREKHRSRNAGGDDAKRKSRRSRSRSRRRRRRDSPAPADDRGRGRRRADDGRRADVDRDRRHGERHGGEGDRHRKSRKTEAPRREAPSGVWGSPGRGDPLGGVARKAAGGDLELERWVMDLDSGRGVFRRYLEPLQREFGELTALAASVLPKPVGNSVVGFIDASVWPALGVEALGHKLTLAKGIVALAQSLGMVA